MKDILRVSFYGGVMIGKLPVISLDAMAFTPGSSVSLQIGMSGENA